MTETCIACRCALTALQEWAPQRGAETIPGLCKHMPETREGHGTAKQVRRAFASCSLLLNVSRANPRLATTSSSGCPFFSDTLGTLGDTHASSVTWPQL